MAATLLLLALFVVALATHATAFDLLPVKRGLFLVVAGIAVLLPKVQGALLRTVGGALRWWVAALALFVVAAAVELAAPDSRAAWGTTLRPLLELALFLLLLVHARDVGWEQGGRLLGGLVLLGGILAAIAVAQTCGLDLVYGEASERVAVATFGNSNAFATFAAPLLAVACARAARRRAWLAAGAAVLLAAALVLARSRGAWLAGAAGLAVVAFALRSRGVAPRRVVLVAVIGALVGVGVNFAVQDQGELGRTPLGLGRERRSNVVRLEVARGTVALVREAPWFGVGPGQFRDEYVRVRPEREARTATREGAASEVDHPHNEPLRLAAEGGILTALLAAIAAAATLLGLSRRMDAIRGDDGTARAALLGGGTAWCIAALPWSVLYDPATALLGALLLGAALASETELTLARPRERPLALLIGSALFLAAVWFGLPPLHAELLELRAQREVGAPHVNDLARAAELDGLHVERQLGVGTQFLEAARELARRGEPSEAALAHAEACFRRALTLVPNHIASLTARAEIEARRGGAAEARSLLERVHALEPWRGPVEPALQALLSAAGHELVAARARFAAEGEAALPALKQQAEQLRAAGNVRGAAQILDLVSERAPDDGDAARELALCMKELGDETHWREAYRRSQLAYAVAALADGRSEEARDNLAVARRYAPPQSALEELLEACIDLQRGRIDAARGRLGQLDAVAANGAWDAATPATARVLKFLAAHPAAAAEIERLGLRR